MKPAIFGLDFQAFNRLISGCIILNSYIYILNSDTIQSLRTRNVSRLNE